MTQFKDNSIAPAFEELIGKEIARELLAKENLSEEEFELLWSLSKGNPWDAEMIFKLSKDVK